MLFLCEEFLLHIPCCLKVYTGSFSYTSRDVLISILGVSLTHPTQDFFFFLFYLGNFSYRSRAGFLFYQGRLSYTSCAGLIFLSGVFLLHIPCWFHFYRGNSLTHPVLGLFLSGEFLLHIPRWLHSYVGFFSNTSYADSFHVGSFSYTSRAVFIFMRGVSLTHPALASFVCGVFL